MYLHLPDLACRGGGADAVTGAAGLVYSAVMVLAFVWRPPIAGGKRMRVRVIDVGHRGDRGWVF